MPSAAAPLLLVLGLHTEGGLRSVTVSAEGITDLGPVLVVPGRAGWTRVEPVEWSLGRTTLRTVVATPAGAVRAAPMPNAASEDCEEATRLSPTFVSERLVAFDGFFYGECGGAHPSAVPFRAAAPLDSLVQPAGEARVAVGDVPHAEASLVRWFGAGAAARLREEGAASLVGHTEDEVECFRDSWGVPDWGIVHRAGRWQVEGYLHYGYEACRGLAWPFPTTLRVPRGLGLREGPVVPAPAGALDWVTAPGASWRVELTADELRLVDAGAVVARLPLAEPQVVQTDWAMGAANVARWRVEAAEAARIPPVPPPTVRFSTVLRGGALGTWTAGPDGLRWEGEGVTVGEVVVDIAAARPPWAPDALEAAAEDALTIVRGRPAEAPGFPFISDDPLRIAGVAVEIVDADASGVVVATSPTWVPGSDPIGEAAPRLRRFPLVPGVYAREGLLGGGEPFVGPVPPPRFEVRSADGRVVATCTADALELRVDGRRVSRARLPEAEPDPRFAEEGEGSGAGADAGGLGAGAPAWAGDRACRMVGGG